jgi:hypothetical protein
MTGHVAQVPQHSGRCSMKKHMIAVLLAGSVSLGACATTDEYGYRDDNSDVVAGAGTGEYEAPPAPAYTAPAPAYYPPPPPPVRRRSGERG